MKKKIAIIGVGSGGAITALHYLLHQKEDVEIDIYYDSHHHPLESVGQSTTVEVTETIARALECNWKDNPIDSTLKTGILYENWSKTEKEFFHPFFYMGGVAMHYTPILLANVLVNHPAFNCIQKEILDPEKDIDADYIFDCRGKNNRNPENYETVTNPLNTVLLARARYKDPEQLWTRCIATKNGWAFVIPDKVSTSFGYMYNKDITDKVDAKLDFFENIVIPNSKEEFKFEGGFDFENYIAKNMFVGERTILNGNRYSFVEPLEATSMTSYLQVARTSIDHIFHGMHKHDCNQNMYNYQKQVEKFILWHYKTGSKFDTPFWKYAKELSFTADEQFNKCLSNDFGDRQYYGQWDSRSFKLWEDHVRQDDKDVVDDEYVYGQQEEQVVQ